MSKKPDASGEIVPDAEIDLRRTQLRNGHKLARMIAADRATLLPCPNPWCDSTEKPEPSIPCGVVTNRHGLRSFAIAEWNTRPDPYDRIVELATELITKGLVDLGSFGGLLISESAGGRDIYNQLRAEIFTLNGWPLAGEE